MKKITSLLILSLIGSIGFSQNNVSSAAVAGDLSAQTEIFVNPDPKFAPCMQETPSNAFENGHGNLHLLLVANDFTVEPNETFTVEQVTLNILVQPGISVDGGDLHFYSDSGAGPFTEIASELAASPTTQTIVGTAFGFDVQQNVFDLATPLVLIGGPTGGTYWFGIQIQYSGASSFWEGTSILNTPNEGYLSQDAGGTWEPISTVFASAPFDGVMTIAGDCVPTLGVNDNIANLVSVYPNPASSTLNFKMPSSVEVKSVALYDLLGKIVGTSYSNGTMNISNLSQGVYILKMNTNAGTLTQKIVKQ